MKYFSLYAIVLFTLNGVSQTKYNDPEIVCTGIKATPLTTIVILNGEFQTQTINLNDLIQHGLRIAVNDDTYKIIGFKATYDCHSGRLMPDLSERTYYGNKINAEDPFIKGIWVGDNFGIECINLERNGVRYLAKGVFFPVR